ncbi:MAG: ABC transporter ATP-binding protein [Gammaproteobacteria bacterium]|nr:ABC transporter ATP-binding protein [Gammaproteobacteria bacterium]
MTTDKATEQASDVHISFDNVVKSYDGSTQVVKDLNLDVNRGEFLTLLGPSGSGKTTCLMMLAGFESITSGTITIDGRAIQDILPHKRGIGMVFQNYALFPHLTVRKNLSFPLEVRGMSASERNSRVMRALELVQLEGLENRKPRNLSGGQQQRVAIARALVFEPEIVLMDEPLGALDRRLREEMQYEIRRIHQQLGVTMVYVTHDQQEAMVLSDRVAVFRDGRIEQIATPETLYEEPSRVFVSSFIGDNNVLYGEVREVQDNDICHVSIGPDRNVQALSVEETKPGEPVWVAIRPERVGIAKTENQYSNQFDAIVNDIVFMGDHLRINVDTCGVRNFIIKIPNLVGHGAVLPGDEIQVGWATLDCRALSMDSEKT